MISRISSKLMFACYVWSFDRAYDGTTGFLSPCERMYPLIWEQNLPGVEVKGVHRVRSCMACVYYSGVARSFTTSTSRNCITCFLLTCNYMQLSYYVPANTFFVLLHVFVFCFAFALLREPYMSEITGRSLSLCCLLRRKLQIWIHNMGVVWLCIYFSLFYMRLWFLVEICICIAQGLHVVCSFTTSRNYFKCVLRFLFSLKSSEIEVCTPTTAVRAVW